MMLANILTAAEITPAGVLGDRDMSGRSGGAGGDEDFSSILARCTGVGECTVRVQTGEYTEHARSVRDFHRLSPEYLELGQKSRQGESLQAESRWERLSGVTERSEEIPSGATERSEEIPSGVTERSEEIPSGATGRSDGVPSGATEGDRRRVAEGERLTEGQKSLQGESLQGKSKWKSPGGRVLSHKLVFGNGTTGAKAMRAFRVKAAPPNALSMAVLRRGVTKKEELNSTVRKEHPGSVRELLEKLSLRRGSFSGKALGGGAPVNIAAKRQKGESPHKQGVDGVQRKAEDPKRRGVHTRLKVKGSGSAHLTLRRAASGSQETMRPIAMERDRFTGGKDQVSGQRLPDTVLSRYEESARSVDIKSNYQNLKNADGNFNEIVRQFNILVKNGGGEARMVLEPEHLGQLRLRIQLDRGEVTTNMVVDNQAVKELIMSRLNVLEESLLEHGFGLGSFEVGVKGENAEGDRSSTEAQGRKVSSTVNPVDNPIPVEGVREQYLPWISSRVNITV